MYDSTERIKKFLQSYKWIWKYTNEKNEYLQNCGEKGSKFHWGRCNTVRKNDTTCCGKKLTIAYGPGTCTTLWINCRLTAYIN